MSRTITHTDQGKNRCSCGARFKTGGKLRSHIDQANGVERVVWITTPLPVQPHKSRGKR